MVRFSEYRKAAAKFPSCCTTASAPSEANYFSVVWRFFPRSLPRTKRFGDPRNYILLDAGANYKFTKLICSASEDVIFIFGRNIPSKFVLLKLWQMENVAVRFLIAFLYSAKIQIIIFLPKRFYKQLKISPAVYVILAK
jgi:hypothetical protein